jgi:hypothetical protein
MIVKPLATELSVSSANTVYDAQLVRIYAAANSVVTIAGNSEPTGSFTLPGGSVVFVEKAKENTIAGTTTLLCTPVSYKS